MREDILTKAEKKRRREHKLSLKLLKQAKEQKKNVHEYLAKFTKKQIKEREAKKIKLLEDKLKELEKQKQDGIVSKPRKMGR